MTRKFIPLMIPDIREDDINAVNRVLKSGMLIQGGEVEKLESSIAKYLGVKHAIAVSNGTATMHLALKILNIGPGDEVIVPAFSYVATANVVELVGAKPIFVDIDASTFNIDIAQIERAITAKTKAILPVHEFGLSCDIEKIVEIAKKYNLFVIEDAACALGAQTNSICAGTLGDFGSFSFHPRKAITSGEGGLLVTNNNEYARRARILRNHGIENQSGKMEFVDAGFNYRMTDFQAALVLSQFGRFSEILKKRETIATAYSRELENAKKITLPITPMGQKCIWQTYHVVVHQSVNRDLLIQKLQEYGIGVNYGAQCIPIQKFYKDKYGLDCHNLFPHAMRAYLYGLALPMYELLSMENIKYICHSLKECLLG